MSPELERLTIYHRGKFVVEGDEKDIKGFFGKAADKLDSFIGKDRERLIGKPGEELVHVMDDLRQASETGVAQDIKVQYTGGHAIASTHNGRLEMDIYLLSEHCSKKLLLELVERSLRESNLEFEYVME